MGSDRYEANCKRCDRIFEYGLFSRNYPYCPDCKDALDAESLRAIGEGKVTWVEDRLAGTSPDKSEMERQIGYTAEDHRWNINRRNES